jgi:hypothetical protein
MITQNLNRRMTAMHHFRRSILPPPPIAVLRRNSMKSLRLLLVLASIPVGLASLALAQSPTITGIIVKDTKCSYKVGGHNNPCSIGPGMKLVVNGSNFGKTGGGVSLCDCETATVVSWSPSQVIVIVNNVTPNASLYLETIGGAFSNNVPYSPLGPVITSIVVGDCTYLPDQSPNLCKITPGTQFTVNGSYFGPLTPYSVVATCSSCGGGATINSWDPNWLTNPSPYNNQIVATASQAICGSTVAVLADTIWSNYVPYTAC